MIVVNILKWKSVSKEVFAGILASGNRPREDFMVAGQNKWFIRNDSVPLPMLWCSPTSARLYSLSDFYPENCRFYVRRRILTPSQRYRWHSFLFKFKKEVGPMKLFRITLGVPSEGDLRNPETRHVTAAHREAALIKSDISEYAKNHGVAIDSVGYAVEELLLQTLLT